MKHSRSVNYNSDITISFVINYNLDFDIFFTITLSKTESNFNLSIFDCNNASKRKKRKLNNEIMTYYYRYLDHFKNIA